MGAVGLQTYIWNNNLKSVLLLLGFPLLLVAMVYALELMLMAWGALPSGYTMQDNFALAGQMLVGYAPLAIGVAVVWFAIAYFSYQGIIDLSTGARKVSRKDQPKLYNLLENLAISRGMKTPALRIIDSDALNAFATGLHEGQYSVTVTRGLMAALDDQEMEAVLAHEMTHVINRDVRLMVIASIFAGIITLLAQVIYRSIVWTSWSGGGRRRGGRGGAGLFILIALAIAALGWVLAIVIKMTISRRREFMADMGSVELTKNPDAMISALRKISGHSHVQAPDSMRAMFIDYDEGAMSLFATHPPIEARIKALVRFGGGRDVAPPLAAPAPMADLPEPHDAAARGKDAVSARMTGAPGPWGRRPGPWA
jgi:heat shock protein HtpX